MEVDRGAVAVGRLAVVAAASTWILLMVGCMVHGTGSSLACPDWPTCHGTFFPEMTGGVEYEHTHRVVATAIGCETLALAIVLWLRRKRSEAARFDAKLGLTAVGLVIWQGVLGGITVLLRLPIVVTLAHLTTSMCFFSLMAFIALRVAPKRVDAKPIGADLARLRPYAGAIALGTLGQILLGGITRHTNNGLSCDSIPLCTKALTTDIPREHGLGTLWPAAMGQRIQMGHRIVATLLAIAIISLAVTLYRRAKDHRRLRALAIAAPILVLSQIALGLFSVAYYLPLYVVTAHLGVAALILVVHVILFARLPKRAAEEEAPASSKRGFVSGARDLVALTKPRITFVVLVTAAGGMKLAGGSVSLGKWIATMIGTALIVGSANALNMWMERDVDGLMTRTKDRPLPTGRLSPDLAFLFGVALAIVSLPTLAFGVNGMTALLGLIALVSYVLVYTPLKRRSSRALWVGAVPGAIPPLLGWTAVTGRLDRAGLALFSILFVWQIPHFLAISLFRADEYAGAGLKVVPKEKGDRATRWMMLRYAIVLLAVTLWPVHEKIAGLAYLLVALALGGAYVAAIAFGLPERAGQSKWAKRMFAYSILHLVILFATLVFAG